MWAGFQFYKSIKVLLADCGSACVQRAAFKEYTGVISPRFAQVNVPWDTTVSITLDEDFPLDLTKVNMEMFGVPTDAYENYRVDWTGFRCDSHGVESYNLANLDIQVETIASTVDRTITFTFPNSLKAENIYVVHIYAGGLDGEYDYKTWWLFYLSDGTNLPTPCIECNLNCARTTPCTADFLYQ